MRRRGHRGHLPAKSVPIQRRAVRSNIVEEQNAGYSRDKVDVDAVMAANFDPYEHVEKFPHGYDPFAGDVTALQKKVVFRPNKHQIDAVKNRKKYKSVNISPGISGQGPVVHEKKFIAKNSRSVPMNAGHVYDLVEPEYEKVSLEKHADLIPEQSAYAIQTELKLDAGVEKNRKFTQDVAAINAGTNLNDFEPTFSIPDAGQSRKHNSIQEEVHARISYNQDMYKSRLAENPTPVAKRQNAVRVDMEAHVNTELNSNIDDRHVVSSNPQNRRHQQTPKKKQASVSFDVQSIPSIASASKQNRRRQTNPDNSSNINETLEDLAVGTGKSDSSHSNRKKKEQPRLDRDDVSNPDYTTGSSRLDFSSIPSNSRYRKTQAKVDRDDIVDPDYNTTSSRLEASSIPSNSRYRKTQVKVDRDNIAEPIYQEDTRDVSRMPNTRPVRQQHQEEGVMLASRLIDVEVSQRMKMALERSRRHVEMERGLESGPDLATISKSSMSRDQTGDINNRSVKGTLTSENLVASSTIIAAESNTRDSTLDVNSRHVDLDQNLHGGYVINAPQSPNNTIISASNNRRWNAKLDESNAEVSIDATRISYTERDIAEQRRQVSSAPENIEAGVNYLIQLTSDSNDPNLAKKQRDIMLVKDSDVPMDSGLQGREMDLGHDATVVKSAVSSKKHVAREGPIHMPSMVEIKEEATERTGDEFNTRQRELIISPTVTAGTNHVVRYKRN